MSAAQQSSVTSRPIPAAYMPLRTPTLSPLCKSAAYSPKDVAEDSLGPLKHTYAIYSPTPPLNRSQHHSVRGYGKSPVENLNKVIYVSERVER